MRPERWWSVLLAAGLLMALSPLSAQAGPNRSFAPQQPNRPAFTRPQPLPRSPGWTGQPHNWQQPRGNAYGWNGQNRQWQQHHGNAYGWNDRGRRDHGNAYGWHDRDRRWDHRYGWNDRDRRWDHRNAYGWNDRERRWDHRNASGWNQHPGQWQQPSSPHDAQPYNGSYNRAGYPVSPQSPHNGQGPSGYNHNNTTPANQTGGSTTVSQPEVPASASQLQSGQGI